MGGGGRDGKGDVWLAFILPSMCINANSPCVLNGHIIKF